MPVLDVNVNDKDSHICNDKIVVSTTFGKFQASFFLKEYISERKLWLNGGIFFSANIRGRLVSYWHDVNKITALLWESDSAGMKLLPEIQPAFYKILLLRPWK